MKIDMHVHCLNQSGSSAPQTSMRYPDSNKIQAHLESQNICHAVIMSTGQLGEKESNLSSLEIVRNNPDFYSWMCSFSPDSDVPVFQRMQYYKQQGAIGVGELTANEWMDSPFLTSVFEAAQDLELPVTIHMSPEPGFQYGVCDRPGLPLLEKTLQKFPELKILGHSQTFWIEISGDCPRERNEARYQWGSGPIVPGGRLLYLFRRYPNLYGDLSAFSGSCAIMRDPAFGLSFLEEFSDRLFFATDTVDNKQIFPLGKFLDDSLSNEMLSPNAYENICFRNAQRIFNIARQR